MRKGKRKSKRGLRGIEADELRLYADNDEPLYRQAQAIRKNLCSKMKKGNYRADLAPKAFKHLADAAAKKYACEVATCREWNKIFSVAERKAFAKDMADDVSGQTCRDYGFGKLGGLKGLGSAWKQYLNGTWGSKDEAQRVAKSEAENLRYKWRQAGWNPKKAPRLRTRKIKHGSKVMWIVERDYDSGDQSF